VGIAFDDVPHNFHLFLKICKGCRPTIIEGTSPDYVELMKKFWDSDPDKRPTADELEKLFNEWQNNYPIEDNNRKEVPTGNLFKCIKFSIIMFILIEMTNNYFY
jgi:hypothetical protein